MNTTGKTSRLFKDHDWESILELDRKYFPRPWSSSDWEELELKHHLVFALRQRESVIGFALFGLVKGDDTAHLLKICLAPEFRGQGEGKALWLDLISELKSQGVSKVFLEVEQTNLAAINFYHRQGFESLREVKGFYSDGVNGIMMLLTL